MPPRCHDPNSFLQHPHVLQTQVSDCALHPADIKVSTWEQVTCAECSEQTYNGDMPEIECFTPSASSPSPSSPAVSTSAEDDDASAGSVDESSSTGAPVDGGGCCFYCAVGVFGSVGVGFSVRFVRLFGVGVR